LEANNAIPWVTVIWSMNASVCLMLGLIHLTVWRRQREQRTAHALFALMAVSTTLYASCELWMMRSHTIEEMGTALRWLHLPGTVFIVATVCFVRTYTRAGRPWLAWSVCGLRTLALILNFYFVPNLNFREITALKQVRLFGESVSVVIGVPNPWMLLGQVSLVLFAVFSLDAAFAIWRGGNRHRAILLGGTMTFFTSAVAVQIILSFWGFVPMPIVVSLFFLPVLAAMGFELADNVIRAAQLSNELRESEGRFRLVVESSPAALAMVDPAGQISLVNHRMETLFGYTRAELIGQPVATLVPELPSGRDGDLRHDEAGDTTRELLVHCKDGSGIDVEIGLNFIATPEGRCMLASMMDRTDRKRAEREAAQHRSELAHLSRVTMLGVLSGSIAHELNQPLTSILSNAQAAGRFLAQEPVDLDEVRDILADIVDEDKRAGEIIHRLRELLRKGEVRQVPLNVNHVVREVLSLIQSDLVNNDVATLCDLSPDLPKVIGDFVQLQQVLLNLIINACDAMRVQSQGDRLVGVRTEAFGDGAVHVSVSDQGEGIAPEKLLQVFEPFYTTKSQGLGLGLSVCRTLIQAHGGQLWATNNDGPGASFHFTLPGVAGGQP